MTGDLDIRLTLDRLRDGDRIELVATDDQCAAVAARLGLLALDRLAAHVVLHRDGAVVRAEGRVRAALDQPCTATGEPVAQAIDEPFAIIFRPEPQHRPDEEIELGGDELDTVFHDGARIALGDAVVDTLALALDPYPRSAGAEAALKEAGVMNEEEASPFAALAALKGKLEG